MRRENCRWLVKRKKDEQRVGGKRLSGKRNRKLAKRKRDEHSIEKNGKN